MDKKELKSILEAGESQTVEFMEGFSDKFMREMVALANAEGGQEPWSLAGAYKEAM